MSTKNILFFSNKCESSKYLISMMQAEKILQYFFTICVDNNPKITPNIKYTPTILLRGVPTPYVAADAFSWLARVKQWKIQVTMKKINQDNQKLMQGLDDTVSDAKVLGFSDSEMKSISDMFSFFDANIKTECQEPLPQSYVNYDSIGQEVIFAPPEEINKIEDETLALKKSLQLQNKLESDRAKQDNLFKSHSENISKQVRQYKKK